MFVATFKFERKSPGVIHTSPPDHQPNIRGGVWNIIRAISYLQQLYLQLFCCGFIYFLNMGETKGIFESIFLSFVYF